jgi:hypothetical protein
MFRLGAFVAKPIFFPVTEVTGRRWMYGRCRAIELTIGLMKAYGKFDHSLQPK